MNETILPLDILENYRQQAGVVLMGAGLVIMISGPKLSELTMMKAKGNIKRGIWRHAEKGSAIITLGFVMFNAGCMLATS